MIQDIYPKILKNEYDKNARIDDNDTVLAFDNSKLLIKVCGEEVEFPKAKELGDNHNYTYLFSIDEERYFLCQDKDIRLSEYFYEDIRTLRSKCTGPRYRMMAAYTGKHLSDWYRDMRYCGRCGKPMKHSETERAMECKECGYTAYPRIMPAVIVGVINKDRLLLTKYRTGFQHYALVAGFTEIGETVEETVKREVMEETGISVKNIKYYKSQPWGSANDILLGFYCEVDGDDTIHMDNNELKFAEWVERENIILQPDDFSLTNEMMKRFKDGENYL